MVVPTASPSPSPTIVPVPSSIQAVRSNYGAHLDASVAASLQAALASIQTGGKYPGASAAVMFPDGSVWTGVSGMAVVSSSKKVTASTLFSDGSISKTFVAALAIKLASAGTIGLDDLLSKYVPSFKYASLVTLRQLLDHTSGLPDLFSRLNTPILDYPTAIWTTQQVLAVIRAPTFTPGTSYHYSNTDFVLLGLAIEKATGKKVAALVKSMFLTPLGLSHTFLQTEEKVIGPEAHGYMLTKKQTATPTPSGTPAPPTAPPSTIYDNFAGTMLPFTAEATAVSFAGAYVSNASDLARWANALYGGYVLDPASLAQMVDISPTMPFKPTYPYGLGFEETTVAGQVAWGHRGHLDGFWAAMEYLPAYHVTIVVLTNADWTEPLPAASTLAKIAIAGA
jgi:D-alanyl-D-alanine carboxypeptidase